MVTQEQIGSKKWADMIAECGWVPCVYDTLGRAISVNNSRRENELKQEVILQLTQLILQELSRVETYDGGVFLCND